MAHVIAFANQKGGVAKTTSTVNLGAALREHGLRILAVDMDPQGNLTMSQGIDTEGLDKSMYDVLVHRTPSRTSSTSASWTSPRRPSTSPAPRWRSRR